MSDSFTTWTEAEKVLASGMPIEYIGSSGDPVMRIIKCSADVYGCFFDTDIEVHSTLRGAYTSLAHCGYDANMPHNWRKVKVGGNLRALTIVMREAVMRPDEISPVIKDKVQHVIELLRETMARHSELASASVAFLVCLAQDENPVSVNHSGRRICIDVCVDDADTTWYGMSTDPYECVTEYGYLSDYPSLQDLIDSMVGYLLGGERVKADEVMTDGVY